MSVIRTAEREIAAILARLELETTSLVRAVEIRDVEVTGMMDDRRQLQRQVLIKLDPIPGSNWG
jgi:hypothetical protein